MYSTFHNSWKSFLKKLFLYHQKRKMIIYVIYFGCVTLVLIVKPRSGTQPQVLWKACQSSLCPFPEETLTLSASSKGKPVSVLTPFLGLATLHLHVCSLASWPCPVPPSSAVPTPQSSQHPASFGLGFKSSCVVFCGLPLSYLRGTLLSLLPPNV